MERIELRSYAKINLCLDVKGVLEGGFHEVEMVMQQILLCDDISVTWKPAQSSEMPAQSSEMPARGAADGGFSISLTTNRHYLPVDERNLAYKAALLMKEAYGAERSGQLIIHIKKRIPVAAGLAGGSGNGAAILHALNQLWGLGLDIASLCKIGAQLGSDVPFCVMGQAAENRVLKEAFAGDPLACHCALATGRGTELKPLKGLQSHLVLSKPPISVSTAEVYRGIDTVEIPKRPDTAEMIRGLETKDLDAVRKNMINVLEYFTLKRYPIVVYTKNRIQNACKPTGVLMSGSGPTVFGLCDSLNHAKAVCAQLKNENRESFWTRTTY